MKRYAWPTSGNFARHELVVRLFEDGRTRWAGIFECALARHLDILLWPEANALVVLAANALYLVNTAHPDDFSGFAAEIEIRQALFDDGRERLFVADSRRIHAWSRNRKLLWVSPALDGYDAVISHCLHGVLTIEYKEDIEVPEDREPPRATVQLRAEDGTLVRWRRPGGAARVEDRSRHSA
jgi:hypothetical protein